MFRNDFEHDSHDFRMDRMCLLIEKSVKSCSKTDCAAVVDLLRSEGI